jgi:hypothetical protein
MLARAKLPTGIPTRDSPQSPNAADRNPVRSPMAGCGGASRFGLTPPAEPAGPHHPHICRANSVGNMATTHSDDHSINGSFTSTDIADHGSVAGNHNDGNVTNPDYSNTATNGSEVDNSHTALVSGNTTTTHSPVTTSSSAPLSQAPHRADSQEYPPVR